MVPQQCMKCKVYIGPHMITVQEVQSSADETVNGALQVTSPSPT